MLIHNVNNTLKKRLPKFKLTNFDAIQSLNIHLKSLCYEKIICNYHVDNRRL